MSADGGLRKADPAEGFRRGSRKTAGARTACASRLAVCLKRRGTQPLNIETMSATKSYEEIIDFIAAGTTPEAVGAFRPSESVQQRVEEVVERSKQGTTP